MSIVYTTVNRLLVKVKTLLIISLFLVNDKLIGYSLGVVGLAYLFHYCPSIIERFVIMSYVFCELVFLFIVSILLVRGQ